MSKINGVQIGKSITQDNLNLGAPQTGNDAARVTDVDNKIKDKISNGNLAYFTNSFDTSLDTYYLTDVNNVALFKYNPSSILVPDGYKAISKNGKIYERVYQDFNPDTENFITQSVNTVAQDLQEVRDLKEDTLNFKNQAQEYSITSADNANSAKISEDAAAISRTNTKISEDNSALYAERADFMLIPKGYYNPVTNSTIDGALTNTPNNLFPNGAFYEVDVEGTSQIAGANFTTSTVLHIGDRLEKIGNQWNLKPNPTTNYELNVDTQQKLKIVDHLKNEIVSGVGNNGGDLIINSKILIIPNTVSGNGTSLSFTVTRANEYTWKAGDTLYVEAILNENTANITNYNGQILEFNLNVKRNISGTVTTFNNVATSTGFQRLGVKQVLLSFIYIIAVEDVEFSYSVYKPIGGVVNNSGGGWVWTVQEVNNYLTKSNETLAPIAASIKNLHLITEQSRLYDDILNIRIESYPVNGGVIDKVLNQITIPIGSNASGTFFRKILPMPSNYKIKNKIEIVFIVKESVAGSMTSDNPNKVSANIWKKKTTEEIYVANESIEIVRLDANTVKSILTCTVESIDIEIIAGLYTNNTVVNNTSNDFVFTLISLDVLNLNELIYVTKSTDVINKLTKIVETNTEDIENSNLSYIDKSVTIFGDALFGATYSDNKLTIPVGSSGANSVIGFTFSITNSIYKTQMFNKIVTFEFIAKVSGNIYNKKILTLLAFARIAGELVAGKQINPQVIYIDDEHIKFTCDCLINSNESDIIIFVQLDNTIVTDIQQTFELENKLYYSWVDTSQKNINTQVLEDLLEELKTEILSGIESEYNYWTNKGIVWCGTSIPWFHQPNSYPDIIGRKLGATMYNTSIAGSQITFDGETYGMSGTIEELIAIHPSFGEHSYENTIMKYLASPYNAKLVIIDHSFNDIQFLPGILGTIDSTNKNTFYGAYDFIIKQILNTYPDVTIVLATCPNRYPYGNVSGTAQHELARTAIKTIADKWGFQVLDFGGKMGFNQITTPFKTFDGVHQTQSTTDEIAETGYRFLLGVS